MLDYQAIDQQIDKALHASHAILQLMHAGDWEEISAQNIERAKLVRALSKCQKNDSFWQSFGAKLSEIQKLDDQIKQTGEAVHTQLLNKLCDNRNKSLGCIQYIKQQGDH